MEEQIKSSVLGVITTVVIVGILGWIIIGFWSSVQEYEVQCGRYTLNTNSTSSPDFIRQCTSLKEQSDKLDAQFQADEKLFKEWCATQNAANMSFEDYKECN